MSQLKIWRDDYLNNFIDTSQKFNSIEKEQAPQKEFWEVDEKDLAYNSLINLSKKKKIEELCLSIGFPERQSKTLCKIAEKNKILYETVLALKDSKKDYKKVLDQYKNMINNPVSFYQKNKKIRNLENSVLTFGSLSLSYSFCSPIILITEIIDDAKRIRAYHEYMIETSDENHQIEEFELFNIREKNRLYRKYQSLAQDLRGNKVPKDLLKELSEQIKYDKREDLNNDRIFNEITKESLIDAYYIFFGSKLGSDFIERWNSAENKQCLRKEFESYIYNNPYVNLGLVDMKLEDFGTKEHIENADDFLEFSKKHPGKNIEIDLGMYE